MKEGAEPTGDDWIANEESRSFGNFILIHCPSAALLTSNVVRDGSRGEVVQELEDRRELVAVVAENRHRITNLRRKQSWDLESRQTWAHLQLVHPLEAGGAADSSVGREALGGGAHSAGATPVRAAFLVQLPILPLPILPTRSFAFQAAGHDPQASTNLGASSS